MKVAGIILLAIGILSTLGALIGASQGYKTSFAGIVFIILGAFLISRANKKKEEDDNREKWEAGSTNSKE